MTPFEAKGWTKDMKFMVVRNETAHGFDIGDVVRLEEDDNSDNPYFCNEEGVGYYINMLNLKPIPPATKDTIFTLKLTGEELVYLAILCGDDDSVIDDNVYEKVAAVLKEITDDWVWLDADIDTLDATVNKVFPPQETPEQKQYKELLAQRKALDVQLAQLSQKLNLKEKIGG